MLVCATALLATSSGAVATGSPDPNADTIRQGLADFTNSLKGLTSSQLEDLAANVPFTDVAPTGADGLNLDSVLENLRSQLASGSTSSLDDLTALLNDPDGNADTAHDGTLLGGNVDLGGSVTQAGSVYDVTLTLAITRSNTTPIDVETSVVTVSGGSLTLGFDLNTSLHLQFDNSKPAGQKLYLLHSEAPALSAGVTAAADFSSSPFDINLGIAKVTVGGTADTALGFNLPLADPDGDGHITQAEFTTSAPEVLFQGLNCGTSHVNLALSLGSSISGLEGVSGTLALNDSTPCSGLDTPTVDLSSLGDFKNMTAADMLSAIAQLASTIQSVMNVGPAGLNLPFLRERAGDVVKLSEKLQKFFSDNGLSATPPESGDDCNPGDTDDDDVDGVINDGCATVGPDPETNCQDSADDDSDGTANDGCPAVTNNPLDLNLDESVLPSFDTIDEVIPKIEQAFGFSPGTLGLAYDPASKALTFHISYSPSTFTKAGTVDFSDQLEKLGIVDVDSASASASISGDYALDVTAGLDLTGYAESGTQCSNSTDEDGDGRANDGCPAVQEAEATDAQCTNTADDDGDTFVNDGCPTIGPSLADRVFIKTDGSEPEFSADFETDADLDLDARIGFLGLSIQDSNTSGSVPLIRKKSGADHMIQVDLNGGADNKLTAAEVLDGLIDDTTDSGDLTPTDIFGSLGDVVNVSVPQFSLDAEANVSGTTIVSGSITVEWPDVLTGAPTITPVGNFNDELLSFDFDHEDPLQLLSRIIDSLDEFVSSFEDLTGDSDALNTPLPIIGKSFKDLVDQIQTIKAQLEEITNDPSATLQDFETQLENLIGQALSIPDAARDGILQIAAATASPTQLTFRLGLGICSAEDGSDPDKCDAIKPLSVPINLDMGGEAISSLVGVTGTGEIALNYAAVANLNFRIKLPSVTPDDGDTTDADAFPDVSGSPGLFLLDTSGIELDANLDASTELQAHLGPLTIGVGETDASPESGTECATGDAVDDDQDGYVNDGCPAVDNAETGTQCDNSTPDDEDDPADAEINDGCPAKANPAIAKVAASFKLANDVGDSGESEVDLTDGSAVSDFFSGLVPSPFSIAPDSPVTCPAVTSPSGDLAACARLPIFVGTNVAGVIKFGATDLLDPNTWDFDVPPDLVDQIFANALDWSILFDGLNRLLDSLKATLDGASYGVTIPGLGKSLQGGADIIASFQALVNQVQEFITSLQALSTAGGVDDALTTWLNDHLGDLLDDSSIDVDLTCDTGSGDAPCADGDPVQSITDALFKFSFGDTAAEGHPKFDIGFPGLRLRATDDPSTAGDERNMDAAVDWSIDLAFGLSKADGFYLLTDRTPGDADTDPEISVDAHVDLPDNASAPDLQGDIAFIRLNIEDTHDSDPDASGHSTAHDVDFQLAANVKGGGSDKKLTLSDLTSGVDPTSFDVSIGGGVHINLHIDTTAEIPGFDDGSEGGLPSLGADLVLDWSFGAGLSIGTGSGLDTSLSNDLDIRFDNITLDLGSWVDDFLGPIVSEVQRYLKPIQPVIDLVSAPIPGIAQLAELVGETPPTMIDLFEAASGADLTFVKRVLSLITFINSIPAGSSLGAIPLGDFDLDGAKVADRALPGNQVGELISSETVDSGVSGGSGVLGSSGFGSFGSKLAEATGEGDKGGFEFPAFQHPTQLFRLLLGQDVTLIEWRSGVLKAEFTYSQNFGPIMVGPIPLSIVVSFSAGIQGQFGIGYDTFGIRKAVEALTDDDPGNNDAFSVVGTLFYGVFLDDLDSSGKDVPEIQLFAEGSVGVALDLVIVSAGIEGGIRATIDMNLHDGPWPPATSPGVVDGKIRIDEILSRIGNPLCLFDVSGKLDAFIRAFVKVGIGPFSKKFDFTIVKITLLDLKNITAGICDVKPVLATKDGDVLRINIGPFAADRKINTDEKKEKVTVRQLRSDGKKFSVTGFGITQVFPEKGAYPNAMTIFADGADGNDSIIMEKGGAGSDQGDGTVSTEPIDFTAPTILCGGPGDDKVVGGDGADAIQGDGGKGSGYTCTTAEASTDGSDELGGRDGADTVNGQGGNDAVAGENGGDTLNAGTGDDSVTGGEGSDSITSGPDTLGSGQTDNDNVQGGPEKNVNDGTTNDTIHAGAGLDNVEGEAGEDEIFGGPNDDNLIGSKNDDTIWGEGGDDVINGADGADELHGMPGNDDIFGDLGSDQIDGGPGNDDLIGGQDGGSVGDVLNGGPDSDILLGDDGSIDRPTGQATASSIDFLTNTWAGNDTENGGPGNDVMYGQAGVDTMNGNENDDQMFGGDGGDTMNGNEHADTMYGEAGEDTMHGNSGEDVMRGGNDHDTMFGDSERDDMNGDAGDDDMQGNDGPDLMRGSVGEDDMQGNADDDEMYGDADEDRMFGNADEDTMFGNADDDYMEGNSEHDIMSGGPQADDMIGGTSTAGANDVDDVMNGDEGTDTMAGDNAQITRNSPPAVVLLDLPVVGSPYPSSSLSGDDTMNGGDDEDRMFGQSGNDTMNGNGADDDMQGNSGRDTMHGNDGADDMLGGSGHDEGGPSGATRLLDSVDDDSVGGFGDDMFGDGGVDYMGGDNANITRPGGVRQIALYDVNFSGGTVFSGLLAGNDTMHGGDLNDLMYGQADEDTMFGDSGDDYMEGNEGRDLMEGNAAADKMVGGSGQDNGGPAGALRKLQNAVDDNVPSATPAGQTGGDQMWGDGATPNLATDGIDYMSGDNSFITGLGAGRKIELYDIPFSGTTIPGDVSGDDTMHGNGANDVMYGQGDDDQMFGDENDDYMEGNSAHDTMHGNADQDDMLGGSGKDDGGPGGAVRELRNVKDVGDAMYGDGAVDYMAGDNTRLDRGGANHWDNAAAARQVVLYDVQTTDGPAIPQNVSGPDYMEGNDGNDVMFGQGNGSQPASSGDPADGVDNDRDASESGTPPPNPAEYDCNDSIDNDGTGGTDAADPQCVAGTDEDASWDGDEMHGGADDDYMEGNHGADWMFGEANEDDMAGGGSEVPDADSRGVWPATVDLTVPTKLRDGNDVLEGGAEDDAIAGDNAFFRRTQLAGGGFRHIAGGAFDLALRDAVMTHAPDPAGAFGKDYLRGNDGNDDEYGEQGNDYIRGNAGQDAQVGDLGLIQNNIIGASDGIADPGQDQFIDINPPFIEDTIYENLSLYRLTTLYSAETGQGAEGDDVMLGDAGNDSMHGSAGADYMNGNGDYNATNPNSTLSSDGEDHLFGGDGPDAIWGGLGHDHIFGGHGDDHMDVVPRPYDTTVKKGPITISGDDPPIWWELARVGLDNFQGTDYIYGGFDKDEMQASYGQPGPRPGDRLIDWVGNTNIYYTCPGAYGEGVITRMHSPGMQAFLEDESAGDGAIATTDPSSSGFRELALVPPGGESGNPVYPGSPGHFTCPPVEANITNAALSVSANPVKAGATVSISATVKNTSADIGDGQVTVRFSANGAEIGRGTLDGIDPLGSETVVLNWDTTGRNGPQKIDVEVDPDNAMVEGDESDNKASITLHVGGTDIAVANSDVSVSKGKPVGNDKVTVTGAVKNLSDVDAKNVVVSFTDNGVEIGRTQIATLAAGGAASVSTTWRPRTAGGNRAIAVTADPDEAIGEISESNNTGTVNVKVIRNKAPNPTFDASTNGSPAKWSSSGSDVSMVSNVLGSTGDNGLSANGSSSWISNSVDVTGEEAYALAIETWGGQAVIGVKQYTSAGKALGAITKVVAASENPHDGKLSFNASKQADYIRIVLVGGVDDQASLFDTARFWLQ